MNTQHLPAPLCNLGEGPLWHRDQICWVDINEKRIHRFDPKTQQHRVIQLDKMVGAIAPRKGGGLIAALQDEIAAIDEETGKATTLARPTDQPANSRFNDGKCDPAGRYWVGTTAKPGTATLYMVDTNHQFHPRLTGVTISNGLAWTRDQKTMYYIDTPTQQIAAFDFGMKDGTISNRRVAITIDPKTEGHPDGMTIDEHDNLWIGLWGGHAVVCINPRTGERLKKLNFPAANCSCCTFGGRNLDELFVTTARAGMNDADLQREPLTGSVFTVKLDVKGLPPDAYAG